MKAQQAQPAPAAEVKEVQSAPAKTEVLFEDLVAKNMAVLLGKFDNSEVKSIVKFNRRLSYCYKELVRNVESYQSIKGFSELEQLLITIVDYTKPFCYDEEEEEESVRYFTVGEISGLLVEGILDHYRFRTKDGIDLNNFFRIRKQMSDSFKRIIRLLINTEECDFDNICGFIESFDLILKGMSPSYDDMKNSK
ncbi:hypothetical protein QNI19_26795 [Cytophagaceae bacterium DM2B3-1]|uniref:Uncharacterized protein n=1 Tax=Xanthocytophaga flava TaxID=3048013 RepID=A0ABT7CS73_9BACT|nr:hypothetical protein [Xanthocytophaga flavus]MDJ1496570.1 hypothetical protein [Xanthocytophaga flavus]